MPPGAPCINIPKKAERMTMGLKADSEALTDPVVNAVVVTVQNTDAALPNLTSIPCPTVQVEGTLISGQFRRWHMLPETVFSPPYCFQPFFPNRKRTDVGMSIINPISNRFDT